MISYVAFPGQTWCTVLSSCRRLSQTQPLVGPAREGSPRKARPRPTMGPRTYWSGAGGLPPPWARPEGTFSLRRVGPGQASPFLHPRPSSPSSFGLRRASSFVVFLAVLSPPSLTPPWRPKDSAQQSPSPNTSHARGPARHTPQQVSRLPFSISRQSRVSTLRLCAHPPFTGNVNERFLIAG